jgi:hypothetical protein
MKNKDAKPGDKIKKSQPIPELTNEQLLNNIAWALNHGSLTISNEQRNVVYNSFNIIKDKLK